MRRVILTAAAVVVFLGLGSTAAKADTLGLDFTSTPTITESTSFWSLGWEFTVNTNITVTALGDFDNGSVANFSQDQQVGLWDSSGDLLASAYVGSDQASTQIGYWAFTAISGVSLVVGDTYIVGAQGGAEWVGGSGTAVDGDITWVQAEYGSVGSMSNSPLLEPTISASGFSGDAAGYLGGNLEYVDPPAAPEPGTMLMLVPALGLLALRRFKRA